MPGTRINLLLNGLPELQALNRRIRQLAALQSALAEVLPGNLATSASVASIAADELLLFADNSPTAAKLRQMAPRILTHLRQRGHELTAIRVQVQLRIRHNPLPQKQIFLGSGAHDAIASLSDRLHPSPLKTALKRLSRR
jgi:hypothetical protein